MLKRTFIFMLMLCGSFANAFASNYGGGDFSNLPGAQDTSLGSPYRKFQIRTDNTSPLFGSRDDCLTEIVTQSEGTGATYEIKVATSKYELDKFVGLEGALSVRSAGFKASADFSKISSMTITQSDAVVLASAKVWFSGKRIRSAKNKNSLQNADYNFFKKCGTAYVSAIRRSAEFYIALKIHFETDRQRDDFAASVSSAVGTTEAQSTFVSRLNTFTKQTFIEQRIAKVGTLLGPEIHYDNKENPEEAPATQIFNFMQDFGRKKPDGTFALALNENDATWVIAGISSYGELPDKLSQRLNDMEIVSAKFGEIQKNLEELNNEFDVAIVNPDAFFPNPGPASLTKLIKKNLETHLSKLETAWSECVGSIDHEKFLCDRSIIGKATTDNCPATASKLNVNEDSFASCALKLAEDFYDSNWNKLTTRLYSEGIFQVQRDEPNHWATIYKGQARVLSITGGIRLCDRKGDPGCEERLAEDLGVLPGDRNRECPGKAHEIPFAKLNVWIRPISSDKRSMYVFNGCEITTDRTTYKLFPYTNAFCIIGPANVFATLMDTNPADNSAADAKLRVFYSVNPDTAIPEELNCQTYEQLKPT